MGYRTFAEKAIGSKYEKKGWPCQDHINKWNLDGTQVIAVADGHGSNDCFRSQIGSQLAIIAAHHESEKYRISSATPNDKMIMFTQTGIDNLKYNIWDRWKGLVRHHWDSEIIKKGKLSDDEIRYKSVSDKYKNRYNAEDKSVVEQYLYNAYGTTLLMAISIETQLLLIQIGDGTCVILQRDGDFRTPVPADDNNILNQTTSLCEDNAHLKIRHAVIDCSFESPTYPVAVFLSTDGVDDCFPVYKNEEHLYKLYTNVIENIIEKGFDATEKELKKDTLPGLTASGSQDDISLAYFIYDDIGILKETFNNIDDEHKSKPEMPQEMPLLTETVPCTGVKVKSLHELSERGKKDDMFADGVFLYSETKCFVNNVKGDATIKRIDCEA